MEENERKKYYSLTEILKKKDINGEKPSIYLITNNRSAGKTTSVLEYSLERFHKSIEETGIGEQIVLLYRTRYEINGCAKLYDDVLERHPEYGKEITTKGIASGMIQQLMLDGVQYGFAIDISSADKLKKYSPIFSHVERALFDEYQLESGNYLKNEVRKLMSTLMTISRGGGSQSREIELFMLGNPVTIMNPYYCELGIHKRLMKNTKFMRGDGWIAEFGFNQSASDAISKNGLFKAMGGRYRDYAVESEYLVEGSNFIEEPSGKSRYLFTLLHNGKEFGVREFFNNGFIYVTTKPDKCCKMIFTYNVGEHDFNTLMLERASYTFQLIELSFRKGRLRFDSVESKNAIFDILALNVLN